jgi:putative salt-induced outer membrane protein
MVNIWGCQAHLSFSYKSLARVTTLAGAFCLLGFSPSTAQEESSAPPRNWEAEVALGGSLSTGNTDRQALDVDAKASHRAGRFEDHYKLAGEFARENGNTTASRLNAGVQSNYDISERFYALGFAEIERDTFSGFRHEEDVGLGAGYHVIETANLSFDIELAAGFRHGAIRGGGSENKFSVRGTALVDYQISDSASLTNETLVSGDAAQFRAEDTLSLTATVVSNLAARISFNIRYNSNPPAGAKKTDTITKAQLVYAF